MSENSEVISGIRDRIFSLLESEKMSQKDLSENLGVSTQTITDWKKGKSKSYMQKLPLIASVLHVNLYWLLDGIGDKAESNNRDDVAFDHLMRTAYHSKFIKFDGNPVSFADESGQNAVAKASPGAIRISVLGTIPAGIPVEAVEDVLDWEEIPESWGSGGREYFGLRVKGDSMYPRYLEGDTVILRKQPTCDSGNDCAVLVNGDEATLKQVILRQDGSVELRPVNPAYPPRVYSPAEVERLPVHILGVVVELRRKIL